MKSTIARYWPRVSGIPVALLATPAVAEETGKWVSPESWFVYLVIFVVLVGSLATLLIIRSALGKTKWSLSDALSEEVEITASESDGNGNSKPIMLKSDPDKTLSITEMRASASRMIAMMGMVIILLMFLGFGAFALFSFATTGIMPASIDKVVNFLMAGLTLFAPYVVNKFSAVFEGLMPKRP